MDYNIKKIIQLGTEENGKWQGGDVLVFFDDESIAPIKVNKENRSQVYERYALQHGMNIDDLATVVENMPDEDLTIADYANKEEFDAAIAEFEAAKKKADSMKKAPKTPAAPVVVPPVTGTGVKQPENLPPERGAADELDDKVLSKSSAWKKGTAIALAIGAGAAGAAAGFDALQDYLQGRTNYNQNIDDENTIEDTYDWFTNFIQGTEFGNLMEKMDETDLRRQVSEDAAKLVTFFHTQTHKEGNFRLNEDGDVYLDLSMEEATALTIFLNYTDPIQLNEILGSYNLDATTMTDYVESAMTKLTAYYMNAQEISGVADIIHDQDSRILFERFENDILIFNAQHDTTTTDKFIKDLYYTYVLNGQPNFDHIPASVKFLVANMMDSFQLKENANAEHAQLFDQYHGSSFEEEIEYFVDNYVLQQPGAYASASEEQKQLYRDTYAKSLIEPGTQLVDMFANGVVMNEDNSTQEQRDALASITDIINRSGYCNASYEQLSSAIANRYSMLNTNDNRPGFDQIFASTQSLFSSLDNYFGYLNGKSDQIAVLINNRRHTAYNNSLDSIVGMAPSDIDAFVNDGGVPTGGITTTTTEEVEYDDLTPEEQQQVDDQKAVIEAEYAKQNATAQGGIGANSYANSGQYQFNPGSVTNGFNGEVYDLNSMGFASGVAYMYAFGGGAPSVQDSQIQAAADAAAENYLNSISKENQDAIARGMGTSWENARAQLKSAYMSGYTSQMQSEISSAIAEGQRMKELTEQEKQFVDSENEKAQEDTESQDTPTTTPDEGITEGEVDIPNEPVPGPDGVVPQPEVDPNTNETGDPNIDVQTGEDELPVGDDYDPEPQPVAPEESVVDDTQVVPGLEEPQIEEPSNDLTGDPNIDVQAGEDEVAIPEGSYEAEPQPEQVEESNVEANSETVVEAAPEAPTVAEEVPTQEAPAESEPVVESEPAVEAPAVVEQAPVAEPVQQQAAAPEVQAPVQQQPASVPEAVIQQAVEEVMNEAFAPQETVEDEVVKTM